MSRNLYSTRSREQILNLLRSERRYLSAAAIYRILRSLGAKISLSTVYRTLDLLAERGLASSRMDGAGEATYVYCSDEHHHHAICRKCGHVEEIGCAEIDALSAALQQRYAFEPESHSLEFYGRCARCL